MKPTANYIVNKLQLVFRDWFAVITSLPEETL